MSRHLLPNPEEAEPGTQTLAGWDQRLRTYYLQINPPPGSNAHAVLLGADFHEIYDTDDFLDVLHEHRVATPDQLIVALFWDRDLGRMNATTDWRSGSPVDLNQPSTGTTGD